MQEKMKDLDLNFTQYKKGDVITGTIVMIGKSGAIVNIGGMRDGIVPIEELDSIYKENDPILVMVTDKFDENGCIVLNAKDVHKAIVQREMINDVKVGTTIRFAVKDVASAGLKGEFADYAVFLPYSQCSKEDFNNKEQLKDREIEAIVIQINSLQKSIVVSTKILKKVIETSNVNYKVGDTVVGTVVKVFDKYAIVMLQEGIKAKISIQDLSYEKVASVAEILEENKEYTFKVLDFNFDYSRINLGYKQLKPNPLDEEFNKVKLGDEFSGVVEKIFQSGALIKLENGLTAFALTQENSERVNTATHHIYKLGQAVSGYISNIDLDNKKLNIITLKKKSDY